MQKLVAKEIEAKEEGHVSYEIQWIIPNWRQVRLNEGYCLNDQKATFETGQGQQLPTESIQTKWLVGLKDVSHCYRDPKPVQLYWQLLDVKEPSGVADMKVEAKMTVQLCDSESVPQMSDDIDKEVNLAEKNEVSGFLDINYGSDDDDHRWINPDGAVQYTLILTLKKPAADPKRFKKLKLEQFSKRSVDKLRENLGTLLNEDSVDGDLKIITSDGTELRACQSILKVQCPVFAGMFNCDLSESKTGIVKVDDICGKTMKILLHYFYTGDLLTGWSDRDTILEFTYAAGKYQVTQVLELLDDLLGNSDDLGGQVSHLDVQLLNMAGKLALKNAEARLLQRISGKIAGAVSSTQLFQLFGCNAEEIYKKSGKLVGEQIGKSKVFDILDYAFGGSSNQKVDFCQEGFLLLAFIQRNRSWSLEKALLKQIAQITSKFTSAEEVFAWFGYGSSKN